VGDIIDGWKLRRGYRNWKQQHTNVVRRILGYAKGGVKVVYILGNHDEFLRPMLSEGLSFGQIDILNQYEHIGVDGRRFLVVHGDLFDGISKIAPWLSVFGDKLYELLLKANTKFNWTRHHFGFGYWSFSKYLKHHVKQAVDFVFQFENNLTDYCMRRGFDGVICGHIHTAEIREGKVLYMNSGDWVESCTALVEHENGKWEIVTWDKIV
jgi:UDP-2,3-diacylglucosamine pyrophosphatase LpxH